MGGVRWAFPCAAWRPRREEWLLAARLVQPEEKERIGRFVYARDAKAALVHTREGGGTVEGLSGSLGAGRAGPNSFAYHYCSMKIPVNLFFPSVGSSSIPDFFRIMKRQFTETEWHVIKSMNNEWMQLDMFHRHWALKESFLKAIGVGIGFNLQRIEFNVSPLQMEIGKVYNETQMLLDGEKEEEWTFEETRLDDDHHIAVALGKQEGFGQQHTDVCSMQHHRPQFTLLTFEDLVAPGIPITPEDSAYWDNFCSKQERIHANV
uniref:L-aminoadipate-semialdehyde dehydrogenase-phosphopantetheinyl transferase n=1 Tax=Pavo cristatus TaxID=9049 RepID=A0A8C9FEM5_PAVCR